MGANHRLGCVWQRKAGSVRSTYRLTVTVQVIKEVFWYFTLALIRPNKYIHIKYLFTKVLFHRGSNLEGKLHFLAHTLIFHYDKLLQCHIHTFRPVLHSFFTRILY